MPRLYAKVVRRDSNHFLRITKESVRKMGWESESSIYVTLQRPVPKRFKATLFERYGRHFIKLPRGYAEGIGWRHEQSVRVVLGKKKPSWKPLSERGQSQPPHHKKFALLPPKDRMARIRQLVELKDAGHSVKQISEMVQLGEHRVYDLYKTYSKIMHENPNSLFLYLTEATCRVLHYAYGMKNPTLIDVQKRIESDSKWRTTILKTYKGDKRAVAEIEEFCMENGIRTG